MKQCEMTGCSRPGQKHHIVFRSQGGLNIPANYKFLCAGHHTAGKEAVHNNRKLDLQLKKETQDWYYFLFQAGEYTVGEIASLLGCKKDYIEKKMRKVKHVNGTYKKEDIIRHLMGGKLY